MKCRNCGKQRKDYGFGHCEQCVTGLKPCLSPKCEAGYETCKNCNSMYAPNETLLHDEPRYAKENLTCFSCPDNKTCEYAYDLYNTDGDCLADK